MSLFYSYETLYSGNLKWELTTVESISMQYSDDKEWVIKKPEFIPKQYCYPKDWNTFSCDPVFWEAEIRVTRVHSYASLRELKEHTTK